ncbi:MAG: transposase [Paludibacteraceae bacterium]|nr:transposase [Paludibacteraceae bacterium]
MSQAGIYRRENAGLTSGAPDKEGRTEMHGAPNKEGRRSVRAEVKHNRLRRKEGHDYAAPGIYLITVTTADRRRILGKLTGASPDAASIQPTTLGEYVIAAFRKMAAMVTEKTGSRIQVYQYQLMPDHFHGILRIHDALPEGWHLSRMIGAWKGDCSREYWRQQNAALTSGEPNKESLFSSGYNDKILYHEGQLDGWYEYLHDNPRRLWLKVHYPDRLRKIYDFKAGKQGHAYTAVGNTFLIKYPERVQVRCHRNLTEEQIQAEVEHYMSLARGGAVLVSPFISPAEKAVYEAAYKERLKIIRIVNRGLDGRFIYPTGRDLKGCSAGFMLVLAPYADYSAETAEKRITRSQCLDMNGYAADIATTLALTHGAHNKENAALTHGEHNKEREDLSSAPGVRPENINTEKP